MNLTKFKQLISNTVEIIKLRYTAEILKQGYTHSHLGNSIIGDVPVFLSDDLCFAWTGIKGSPMGMALVTNGVNEIYINKELLELPGYVIDAAIIHEVGHLKDNAIYYQWDKVKAWLGVSNTVLEMEFIADKFAHDNGQDMLGALRYLEEHYPDFRNVQTTKRIQRLESYK